MNALRREVPITNQRGLHARASAKFVNLASGLDAVVEVEKDGNKVCGTSIMGLMMLGAAKGDSIIIHVSGMDAEGALEKLATLVEAAPDGPEWLHEIKYDGYRLLARIEKGKARLITRNGLDWTTKFPALARAMAMLASSLPSPKIPNFALPLKTSRLPIKLACRL